MKKSLFITVFLAMFLTIAVSDNANAYWRGRGGWYRPHVGVRVIVPPVAIGVPYGGYYGGGYYDGYYGARPYAYAPGYRGGYYGHPAPRYYGGNHYGGGYRGGEGYRGGGGYHGGHGGRR